METNPNNNSLQNNSVFQTVLFVVFVFFFPVKQLVSCHPVFSQTGNNWPDNSDSPPGRTVTDPLSDGKGEAPSLPVWGKNLPPEIPVGLTESPVSVQPLPVSHSHWLL